VEESTRHLGKSGQKKVLRIADKVFPQANDHGKNQQPKAPVSDSTIFHADAQPFSNSLPGNLF